MLEKRENVRVSPTYLQELLLHTLLPDSIRLHQISSDSMRFHQIPSDFSWFLPFPSPCHRNPAAVDLVTTTRLTRLAAGGVISGPGSSAEFAKVQNSAYINWGYGGFPRGTPSSHPLMDGFSRTCTSSTAQGGGGSFRLGNL